MNSIFEELGFSTEHGNLASRYAIAAPITLSDADKSRIKEKFI